MKKPMKVLLAVLGGINTTFNLFLPIFIAYLIVNNYAFALGKLNIAILLWSGYLSSFYRALSLWTN